MKYPLAAMTMLGLLAANANPAHANNSSLESALASQGDTSVFYRALVSTGVAGELREDREYTVFVPTNAAFAEIQLGTYPCFYSAQCRVEVAAILRNHIVPSNESIQYLARWSGGIPTLGNRSLRVEEPYKGQYAADGHRVMNRGKGDTISLYRIDGVIIRDDELARFQRQPLAGMPGATVTRKTVTTYRTPATYPVVSQGYEVPGGRSASPNLYVAPGESTDAPAGITTITRTTTTESSQ